MFGELLSLPVRIINAPLKIADGVVRETLDEDMELSEALQEVADAIQETLDEDD